MFELPDDAPAGARARGLGEGRGPGPMPALPAELWVLGGGGAGARLPGEAPLRAALPAGAGTGDPLLDVLRFNAAGLRTLPPHALSPGAAAAVARVAADPAHVALRGVASGGLAQPPQLRADAAVASAAATAAAAARVQLLAEPHAAAALAAADAALLEARARADAAARAAARAHGGGGEGCVEDAGGADDDGGGELRELDGLRRRRRGWLWSPPQLPARPPPPLRYLTAEAEVLERLRCRRAVALARAREVEERLPLLLEEQRAAARAADAPPLVPRDSAGNRVKLGSGVGVAAA